MTNCRGTLLPVLARTGISCPGRRRSRQLAATLLIAALSACSGGRSRRGTASAPLTVTDNTGHVVELPGPAMHVISLVPARTDLILALGAADRLIARTAFDQDPRIADLPSIGDALSPSVEWIATRRPDLVIAWPDAGSRSVVSRLDALGIPVYTSRVETLAELDRTIREVGQLLGLEARADSIDDRLATALAAVRGAVRGRVRPRVLYVIGLDPPVAAGPGTFVEELIEAAGGENVMADSPVRWPQVSVEHVLAADAQVVILATERPRAEALAELRRRPGWRDLPAVRDGRVHVVDADLFNRPGPSLIGAVASLARVLHPDAFADSGSAAVASGAGRESDR